MRTITFDVEGRPTPQGSMVASYNRKQGVAHVHHVQGAALALWRASVRQSAKTAMDGIEPTHRGVAVELVFYMPRPNTHVKLVLGREIVRERYIAAQVTTTPDLDKLVRATLDALTGICYLDDSQVVELNASKVYALTPGMRARIGEHVWTEADAARLGQDSKAHHMEGQGDLLSLWKRRGE